MSKSELNVCYRERKGKCGMEENEMWDAVPGGYNCRRLKRARVMVRFPLVLAQFRVYAHWLILSIHLLSSTKRLPKIP